MLQYLLGFLNRDNHDPTVDRLFFIQKLISLMKITTEKQKHSSSLCRLSFGKLAKKLSKSSKSLNCSIQILQSGVREFESSMSKFASLVL